MSRHGGGYSPPRAPERWDRDRFEAHSRGPPVVERDRYEEVDYYSRPTRRDPSMDFGRRSPPRFQEKDRYYYEEKERFGAPMPHRPRGGPGRYYDEEGDTLEGAMVPVRHKERDREIEIDIRSRERYEPPARRESFTRPQFIRRQSSLDTFDRKPMPRYGDRVREEVITIPSSSRRRSPPRYVEQEIEEIKVAEPEFYGDEDYRGYREREISRIRRNRPEEIIEEREEIIENVGPKRGKTKMPSRLVNRRAIIELGYPFEEEVSYAGKISHGRSLTDFQGETIIILQALGKEHIDEVIKISREYNAAPAPLPPPPPAPPEESK